MPAHRLWMKSGASGRAIDLHHAPIDDHEDHDGQGADGELHDQRLE